MLPSQGRACRAGCPFLGWRPVMDQSLARFRRLDSENIIATVEALQRRIAERFPGSGLGNIVSELRRIAEETVTRTAWIQKPHLPLRVAAVTLSLGIVALAVTMVFNIREYRQCDDAQAERDGQ